MVDLTQKKCVPCEVGTPPMEIQKATEMLKQVPGWMLIGNKISKSFTFPDFKTALEFVNKIGAIAEEEGHHPDIQLFFGKVIVTLYTHAANGLTENDFIMAAKISEIK